MHWTHKIIVIYNDGRRKQYPFMCYKDAENFYNHLKAIAYELDIFGYSPILGYRQAWQEPPVLAGGTVVEFVNDGQHQSAIVIKNLDGIKYCLTPSNDHKFLVSEVKE